MTLRDVVGARAVRVWALWAAAALVLAAGAGGCDEPDGTSEARSVALPKPPAPNTPVSVAPPSIIVGEAPKPGAAEAEPPPPVVPGNSEQLAVAAATPRGPVDGPVRATVTFDRPIRPLGRAAIDARSPARIEPEVAGVWRWLGSATLEFDPAEPLPLATEFTVTVGAGLTALDGARLTTAYRYTFSTPPLAPQSGTPVSAWHAHDLVEPEQVFEVVFNQAPAEGEVAGKIRIEGGAEPVAVVVVDHRALAAPAADAGVPSGDAPGHGEEGGEDHGEQAHPQAAHADAADRRVAVKFKPARPLALDTAYQLVFAEGLRGAVGTLPSTAKASWGFRTYGPLTVKAVICERWQAPCAHGPLDLAFSTPVTQAALKRALSIEPPVNIRWGTDEAAQSRTWTLDGNFKPATRYTVRIGGGAAAPALVDVYGQALATAFEGPFATGDLSPWLDTVEDLAVIEANLSRALPLDHTNLASVKVGRAPLDEVHAVKRLKESWEKSDPPGFAWQPLALSDARNVRRRTHLDLSDVLPQKGASALVRVAWHEGKDTHTTTTYVQSTELAIHSKVSPTNIHAWVWRMADGQPVLGAEVDVLDATGKVLATARTDETGVAQLPGVDALPLPKESTWGGRLWDAPWFVLRARFDGDAVRVAASGDYRLAPYRFDAESAWDNDTPEAQGLVFADRGIYRPGETVYAKGLLRVARQGRLETPAGRAVEVRLVDPKGAKVLTEQTALSAFGGFWLPLALPAEGALGRWTVEVEDKAQKLSWSTSVEVAEYRAPAFLVDVTRGQTSVVAGEPITAGVEGRYLFGGPMAGAETRWALLTSAADFEPPDADGFRFGRDRPWWQRPSSTTTVEARGEGVLDAGGRLEVQPGVAKAGADHPLQYIVEAQVTDVDRQAGGSRARVLAHPAALYLGLRGPGGFATATEAFQVEVVARAASEAAERVEAKGVTLKLLRQDWQTVKKQNVSGNFETVSEPQEVEVQTCTVDATVAAVARCTLTAPTAGEHFVVAEAKDAAGRTARTRLGLWVVGEGYASWLKGDDNRVEVIADKPRYAVGDTVKVLVQSPFPESEAWVTVERQGVLWQRRLRLTGSGGAIEVPVTADMIPNAFIGVVLARGRTGPPTAGDPERPTYRVGYRSIQVDPAQKRLAVALKPDAGRKYPGDPLSIHVEVLDHAGAGAVAEVAVWAVDEGVLALTGYEAPDPLAAMHGPRGLSVRQASSLNSLVAQLAEGEKGNNQGGGGGDEDADRNDVRRKFVTTPIFVGATVTDAQGRATVQGVLPDNLTTFRLMAVAVTAGDQGGRGQSKVVVNKPLMARPALPRTLRVGDRFAAGAVIHATSGETVDVTVTAEISGAAAPVSGAVLTRKLPVPAGRGVEVRFPFVAAAIGEAKLTVRVEGGGHRDTVETTLPVRAPNAMETLAIYGSTDGNAREALALPEGLDPRLGGLELSLASSALHGLADQGQDLIEYPYGCLEQQTSRLVPLVAFKALLDQGQVAWMGARKPAEVVAASVKAIAAMQRPDGGFGYWPGALQSHYWGTGWAVLGLTLARDAGYSVAGVDLPRALKFLKTHLDRPVAGEWGGRTAEDQAFGLYVLARNGQPDAEMERRLFDRHATLALFAKGLFAASLNREGGAPDRAKKLLTELVNAARIDADRVHFEEVDSGTYAARFSSDTRTTAIGLLALLALDPQHVYVPRVVRHLVEARRSGAYQNTQAAAWALLALHDYAQKVEGANPDFLATVALGAGDQREELVSQRFGSASLTARPASVPMARLAGLKGERALSFELSGQGRLHYSARLRYTPTQVPTEALEQGLVVQRWYTPAEGPVRGQVTSVAEGALVRVNLRIANHQVRHYVAIEDPLPAGLEPVDPALRTSARLPGNEQTRRSDDAAGHPAPTWVNVFDHREIRDDRVLLFADRLPPGVHSFSYLARATTAGTFLRPPARAAEMYHPEVNGRSTGGKFWIHPRAEFAGR